ncbi:MAG: DUF2147 domain-containing protein [Myxococcaceae bacterium]|nr:DUF2147 domain-containing protein [Myxococcaceae bacterium]
MTRLLILASLLFSGVALAQETPVGVWKTIDDATKKEKSLVRITESNGVITGRIEKLLDPTSKQDAVCDKCSDERKNQPILGMTIIRNVKKSPHEKDLWESGDILDPNNGQVYRVLLKPIEGGKKLEVRGYMGIPLLGRTQIWIRAE